MRAEACREPRFLARGAVTPSCEIKLVGGIMLRAQEKVSKSRVSYDIRVGREGRTKVNVKLRLAVVGKGVFDGYIAYYRGFLTESRYLHAAVQPRTFCVVFGGVLAENDMPLYRRTGIERAHIKRYIRRALTYPDEKPVRSSEEVPGREAYGTTAVMVGTEPGI